MPLVANAGTVADAALALNSAIWEVLGVRYEPNLSPALLAPLDVLAAGRASCSGLSLLLVAACRSVGVPARVAGVGDWGAAHGGGNHVWVEVFAAGDWRHLGAAEPAPLGQTWFDERLRPADGPRVFASTYRRGAHEAHEEAALAADAEGARQPEEARRSQCCCFPLPWRAGGEGDEGVPAIEVTERYREGGRSRAP